MDEHQVIIVGSGPAGAACAKALKDEGISVLLIEKERLPRHKICSGVLFGQTQLLLKKYFGDLPPKEVYCEPKIIKACNILEWNRESGFSTYIWEIPKDGEAFPQEYYNAWRNKFDYWLLGKAAVEYRDECALRNYSLQNNRVKVEVSRRAKGNEYLYCSYLIGADGANSRVRMILDPSWIKEDETIGVYQGYYRVLDMGSLEDTHWYVFFEPEVGDIFSGVLRKDEFLSLFVGGFKGRSLKKSIETLKNFLSENFHVVLGKMERDEGCAARKTPPYLGKDRVLLTGEAAGMVYLNGEGISAALDSGYRAGKAVAQGIKEDRDVLAIYATETEGIVDHIKLCSERRRFLVSERK